MEKGLGLTETGDELGLLARLMLTEQEPRQSSTGTRYLRRICSDPTAWPKQLKPRALAAKLMTSS